jgi:hypothetical protein
MRQVAQMLATALGRDEVLRMARAQSILKRWDLIVGDALAERSWPDKFERGTVWVAVEGSAWAQELRMIKELILDRLRERSGDPSMFIDLRFGVRPLRKPAIEVETQPMSREEREIKSAQSIREIAESIFASAFARCESRRSRSRPNRCPGRSARSSRPRPSGRSPKED